MPGIPELDRPIVDISATMPYWQIMQMVQAALHKNGYGFEAREFAKIAAEECEGDSGMVLTIALVYVRLPGQEPTHYPQES